MGHDSRRRAHRPRTVLALALTTAGGVWAAVGPAGGARTAAGATPPIVVYVGTYTDGASRGIYRFTLDAASGATSEPVLAAVAENPSFLAVHPRGNLLFAVNETADLGGETTGAVSVFAIEPPDGALRLLNQQPSRGGHPCHLALDREGGHVLVANYSGGNVAILPVAADGRLEAPSSVRAHEGTGPRPGRQERPHAHGVVLDPAERFALASDLGADRIFVHRFDPARGGLEPHDPPFVALAPGSGPRHVVFHPSRGVLYAINELSSTVSAFAWDAEAGRLSHRQTVTTLPPGFDVERNSAAEIAPSPDGRFLYASNRGHDSLAVFAVDGGTGALTPRGHVPTGGRTPRHFAIDATGRWLLAANQGSGSIVVFRLDPEDGLPRPAGATVRLDKPVCVQPVSSAH